MASKKLTNKVKDDDLDFELDYNFDDDFDKQLNGSTKERSPVARSFKGAIGGVKSQITNTAFIEKNIRQALPREYGEIYDTTKNITGFVPELYNEAVKEIKPALQSSVKAVKKLVPMEMKRTNKLFQKLSELVGDPYDPATQAQERENQINSELSSIFLEQAKTYSEDRAEDLAKEDIREQLSAKRHKTEADLLTNISIGVRSLSTYNERVNAAYQKKTLELQYRSYFLQQDLLKTTREYFSIFKQQNENVVKNTSLPDLVKMRKSEQFIDIARQKFFNNKLSLFSNSQYVKNITTSLKKQFKENIGSTRDLLQELAMMGAMAPDPNELAEMEKDLGMAPSEKPGKAGLVGSFIGSEATGSVLSRFGKYLNAKMTKPGSRAQKYGYKGLRYLTDIRGSIKNAKDSKALAYSLDDGIFKSLTKETAKGILESLLRGSGLDTTLQTEKGGILSLGQQAIFNNQSQKSLVTVIPGYLSRIYREIQVIRTGNTKIPLTEYDLTSNKFVTQKQLTSSTKEYLVDKLQKHNYAKNLRTGASELLGDSTDAADVQEAFAKIINKINFADNIGFVNSDQLLDPELYRDMDPKLAKKVQEAISKTYDKNSVNFDKKELDLSRKMASIKSDAGDIRGDIQGMLNAGGENTLVNLGLIKKTSDGGYEINMDRYRDLSMEIPTTASQKREYRPRGSKGSYTATGLEDNESYISTNTLNSNELTDAITRLTDKLSNTTSSQMSESASLSENDTLITISQNVIDIRKLLEMRRVEYELQKTQTATSEAALNKIMTSGKGGWDLLRNKLIPNIKSWGSKVFTKAEDAKDYIANLDEKQIDELVDKASQKKKSLFERGKSAKDSIFNWFNKTGLSNKAQGALDKAGDAKDYIANLDEAEIAKLTEKGKGYKDTLFERGKKAKDSILGWFNQTGLTQKAENTKGTLKNTLSKENLTTKLGQLKESASSRFKRITDLFSTQKETSDDKISEEVSDEAKTEEGRSYLDVVKEAIKLKSLKVQETIEKYKEKNKAKAESDKSKPTFNDKDGDGVRDGAWQTLIGKAKRFGFKGEIAKPGEARYTGGKSIIGSLFGAAGGLFDGLKNSASGLVDLFSLGKDALTGKIGKGQFFKSVLSTMGGLVPESFAGAGDKLATKGAGGALSLGKRGLQGALTLGKQSIRGIGNVIKSQGFKKTIEATRSLDKRIVLGAANVAKEGLLLGGRAALKAPGALLRGALNVGRFGLPLLGEGAMAAGAAAIPLLFNPFTYAIAGGVAAYGLYKYATRNKANDTDIVRLRQYGLTEDNKSNYHNIFELEDLMQDKAMRYYENGVYIDDKALRDDDLVIDMLDIFDIEKDDQERIAAFSQWFLGRFKPVIEKHAHALFSVNRKLKLDETKKLKSKELERYLNTVKGIPDSIYNVRVSPFEDISELTATKQDAESAINKILNDIKSEGTVVAGGGKHVLEKIDPSIKSSVVTASVIPTDLAGKAYGYLKNIGTSVLGFATRAGEKIGGFFKRSLSSIMDSGAMKFIAGLFSAIKAPIDKIFTDNITALTAVRLKAYGLPKLEMSKVNSLIALETQLADYVKIDSNNNAVFTGDIEEVLSKAGQYFGISSPSDPRAGDWMEWFKDRFLPVYLTYVGTSYQYCNTTIPVKIMASLRESNQYDVAMKIMGVKDIWDIKTSPWSDMPLNLNPQSAENNLNYLKDKTKDKILKEQGASSSTKDENAKTLQRLSEEGKLESSFLGKLWGDTKNIANKAWNATKEVVGGAWDSVKEGAGKAWDAAKTYAGNAMAAVAGETEPSDTTPTEGGGYSVGGKGMVPVDEQQRHSTRRLPITAKLKALLARAGAAAGIDKVVVFSGGQPATGPNRVGSHRHDFGNAADIRLIKDGKHLNHLSPNDLPYYKSFAKAAAGLGATGIGAGPGYMGPTAMHVGFGPKTVWGRGGRSAAAPVWLKQAVGEGWKSNPNSIANDAFNVLGVASNTTKNTTLNKQKSSIGKDNLNNQQPVDQSEKEPLDKITTPKGASGTRGGNLNTTSSTSNSGQMNGSQQVYRGGRQVNPEILSAIKNAANTVGVDYATMLKIAAVETKFRNVRNAAGGSAAGLFQFIPGTWNAMLSKYGKKYGYGPGTSVMDIKANALMAAHYLKENMQRISKVTNKIGATELYFAHLLGDGGGPRFLRALQMNPNALPAAVIPPAHIRANALLLSKNTLADVYRAVNAHVENTVRRFDVDAPLGNETTIGNEGLDNTQSNTGQTIPSVNSSQPLPGQQFKIFNDTVLGDTGIKTPPNAMTAVPANTGIVPTSFTPQQQSMYSGFVGPIKPNAMDIYSQNRIQSMDKGGSFDFGGLQNTTSNISDTLTKSLDVQTEMLGVLKTMAQNMTPEAFSNMVKGMVPVSNKETKPNTPLTKTQHKRPESMPKAPVSLARTNV